MKAKKILKIIGIILLILIILLLVHTIRNFIIVSKLQKNISKYANSTNYHVKIVSNESNGIMMTTNYYKKDNKETSITERNINGEISKISLYVDNGKKDLFIENTENKIAKLDTEALTMTIQIYNSLESDSTWHTILSSMHAHIKSEKNYYIVSNYPSFITLMPMGKNEYYIDKDTGLLIKSVTNDIVAEREFEFNNVDDSIFIEPDISQFTIQEDN